jgi:hypothetical protein
LGSYHFSSVTTDVPQDFASGWPGLIFFELVSLGAKLVDLIEHPLQQRFRRGCEMPGL